MDSITLMNHEESEYRQNLYQKNFNSIRDSILNITPTAYENAAKQTNIRYHNARGTKLMESGDDVLEIQIGGSGHKVPKKPHKDLSRGGYLLYTATRHEVENDASFHGKAKVRVKFDEMRTLARFKINDPQKFEEWLHPHNGTLENGVTRRKKELIERNIDFFVKDIQEGLQEESIYSTYFGENYIKDDERLSNKHIYKKNSTHYDSANGNAQKTKLSMAGPLPVGGRVDAGTYSINHLKEYILISAQNYLAPAMNEWYKVYNQMQLALAKGEMEMAKHWKSKLKKSHVLLSAHSRGAVAASQGAMMIKYWLNTEFPEYADWVNFEIIQKDPVPGYDSDSDFNNEVDYRNSNKHLSRKYKFWKMQPLGEKAETTVMYTMATEHRSFFAPQKVKGAKRVIIMLAKHDVQLNDVDIIDGERHQATYTDYHSGERYRGTGISELPAGVYLVDEKKQLIKMKSYDETCRIMNRVLNGNYRGQEDRFNRIQEVLKDWFDRDATQQKIENMNKELQNIDSAISPLKGKIAQTKEKIIDITKEIESNNAKGKDIKRQSDDLQANCELFKYLCDLLKYKENRKIELQKELEQIKQSEQIEQDTPNCEAWGSGNDLKENVTIMQGRFSKNSKLKSIWKETAAARNQFWACINNEASSQEEKEKASEKYRSLMRQKFEDYLKKKGSRRDAQLHLFNYLLALDAFARV